MTCPATTATPGHDHSDAMRRTAARNVGRLWVALRPHRGVRGGRGGHRVRRRLAGTAVRRRPHGHRRRSRIALALGAIVVANRASPRGRAARSGCSGSRSSPSLVNAILHVRRSPATCWSKRCSASSTATSSVEAGPMLVVAILGLVVNLVVFLHAARRRADSLAVRRRLRRRDGRRRRIGRRDRRPRSSSRPSGWDPIDPIVAAMIAVWILPRAWRLGASALRVLLQVAPEHVDLDAIRAELLRAARVSSTCTTSTCGRSRRRWTSPART